MPKFKNISTGARGFYSDAGLVMVEAGAEIDATPAKDEDPNEEWFAKAGSAAARQAEADEADPLDHDGNGRKGGARKPAE